MSEIFGDYVEAIVDGKEFLQISFSTNSVSLQQRWRNNGLSADFMADYLVAFFPDEDSDSVDRRAEIKDAVSYVANELLENAMKFNFESAHLPASIQMQLEQDGITFYVTNAIDPHRVDGFKRWISELLDSDPNELYMQRLIENEEDNGEQKSGLGFLVMLNNYQAQLAWKFQTIDGQPQRIAVTTMVTLPL